MNLGKITSGALLCASLATASYAALSSTFTDWAKGPVQFIMTPSELATWRQLTSDDQAQQFVDLFWARRDPTPATPQNEYREDFEARVKYADDHFKQGRTRGAMTDLARVFIVLGAPTQPVQKNRPDMTIGGNIDQSRGTGGTVQSATPNLSRQIWIYEDIKSPELKKIGLPTAEFDFADQYGNNQWTIEHGKTDVKSTLDRVNQASIDSPNLTSVPTYELRRPASQPPAPVAVAAPAEGATTGLRTPALQAAVTGAFSGKTDATKASVTYAELVAPSGDYYVPLELYVPASAGLNADAADTIFGQVRDSSGTVVSNFEEPARLTATKNDFFVDKTINVGSGDYTAVVGLAKAGQPVLVTSAPLALKKIEKDAVGTSKLILWNHTYELSEAAPVKSPFAFGKLKIVPKADMVFGNKDELGYFIEVHNPGIDPAANLPKLQMKLELSGTTTAGKAVPPMTAPLSDPNPLPLAGAPGAGQYAVIGSLPLGELKTPLPAGDYVLKVKLIDTISKQTYNIDQKFKLTS
jgi:GWxTD domain-containing protein